MPFFSRKKKRSPSPPRADPSVPSPPSGRSLGPLIRLLDTNSQSQPVYPWSAHAPPYGQSPSSFLRHAHALSPSATAAGELFLFGGYAHRSKSPSNDLYMISTRDFSTTLLQTSGDVPGPRYGHRAVLASTTLFIWGGRTDFSRQNAQNQSNDDSLYLLNLVSREWTRIVVDGPGPGGRYYHTMTLVGSKLFVFGGRTANRRFNDIWALDLNYLKSNPFWESYEPTPGNEKPLSRAAHVTVTTGDCIIIFGGGDGPHYSNDTWSFNILTRKWTELECTGSIPSPRASHAAALIDDVMYVFGGSTHDGTYLGILTAFNLSTQRWTMFQDIGPSPCGLCAHAMACDGTRVFVLGGESSPGAQVDKAKPIHVLDTKLLHPKPDSNSVKYSKKVTQVAQKLSAPGRPQHGISSSSGLGATQGTSPYEITASEDMSRPASPQITHERNPSLNGLPSQSTGVYDRPRWVPQRDDDSESSTEQPATRKHLAPDTSSEKEVVWSGHERLIELERQLLLMRAVQTERERCIAQLADKLVKKRALLEQAEANAAEAKKCAGLEQRKLQARLDELLLSRDQALEQAEANAAEETRRAGLELRKLQAKLDESLLSRDHALEPAQSALQKASCAAEANEQSQRELAEVHAKLEARESELAEVRLRLTDAEGGWAKSRAEADTLRAQTVAGLVNTDVGRVMHGLVDRIRTMESEMSSMRGNEKSMEWMECRNEG